MDKNKVTITINREDVDLLKMLVKKRIEAVRTDVDLTVAEKDRLRKRYMNLADAMRHPRRVVEV